MDFDDRAQERDGRRCIEGVPSRNHAVVGLAVDVLKTDAEVSREEAKILALDARAKDLFARLSELQARAIELGLTQPVNTQGVGAVTTGTISPDTYIDQRSGLVDKGLFLRLARQKAFPSKKIGKRVVARWGDVQAALSPAPPNLALSSINDNEESDPELDEIRARVGLAVRGGRWCLDPRPEACTPATEPSSFRSRCLPEPHSDCRGPGRRRKQSLVER